MQERFPIPWVCVEQAWAFVVNDANRRRLVRCAFAEGVLRKETNGLTRDEARAMARWVASLPDRQPAEGWFKRGRVRFDLPWAVMDGYRCFFVRDGVFRRLASIAFRDEPEVSGRRNALTRDEARDLAVWIADSPRRFLGLPY